MHASYLSEREECEGFGEWLQQQKNVIQIHVIKMLRTIAKGKWLL